MRKILVGAGVLSLVALSASQAQNCPAGSSAIDPKTIARDACQQTYDVYQYLAPQLAAGLSGGNATLGQPSTLGGLGHFSVGVRVNAIQGAYPEVNKFAPSTSGTQTRQLPTKDMLIPVPTADAAIGLLGGFPLGVTNILTLDALVSAAYVPSFDESGVSVTPEQNLQLGYGARVGLLQESIVVPGVSLTYLKRDLPTTNIVGTTSNSNQLRINKLKVETSAWRIVVNKNFLVLGLAAGVGQDMYDQSADISASTTFAGTQNTATVPGTSQSRTRTNYFGDVSLNLPFFRIVVEAGQVTGGDAVNTFNSFSGRADRSLTYYSAGIRFGF